jgi:predicted GNAT family N-acyltransferase
MAVTIKIVQTPEEFDLCYRIRTTVFVEEQEVPLELEMDEYDAIATHFLLRDGEIPLATARLLDKHGLAKIGRVAVLKEARGQGLGLLLMSAVIEEARLRGFTESVLDAQTYAVPFYARLGYIAEGEEFDDAGIPHFLMRRKL